MKRLAIVLALALAIGAVALPVEGLAGALTEGGGTDAPPVVLRGIWILKGVLLAHAILAIVLIRSTPWERVERPLVRYAAPTQGSLRS